MVVAERTHCTNGHPWITENIRQDIDLRWRCKICESNRKKKARLEGRTACKRGHPWPENLQISDSGTHYCKECRALRNQLRKDHKTLSGREREDEPLPEAEPLMARWWGIQITPYQMHYAPAERVKAAITDFECNRANTSTIVLVHESYKEQLTVIQERIGENTIVRLPVHAKEPKPCNNSTFYLR